MSGVYVVHRLQTTLLLILLSSHSVTHTIFISIRTRATLVIGPNPFHLNHSDIAVDCGDCGGDSDGDGDDDYCGQKYRIRHRTDRTHACVRCVFHSSAWTLCQSRAFFEFSFSCYDPTTTVAAATTSSSSTTTRLIVPNTDVANDVRNTHKLVAVCLSIH